MKHPLLLAVATMFVGDVVVAAQPDPAPIRCYREATDHHLSSGAAVQLCMGARSDAPAARFREAVDNARISDPSAVRLCRGTTSQVPASCVERLRNRRSLDERAMVRTAPRRDPRPADDDQRPWGVDNATARTTLAQARDGYVGWSRPRRSIASSPGRTGHCRTQILSPCVPPS
jgi:hypothetical protein